jgi:tetratricopeptide (TPR) repeat protein
LFFEKAVNANPHSILSLIYLGNTYLELGRIIEAVDIFNLILTYEPGNISAHISLSNAYLELATLNISQASASAEQRMFDLTALVNHLRRVELRKAGRTPN